MTCERCDEAEGYGAGWHVYIGTGYRPKPQPCLSQQFFYEKLSARTKEVSE